MQPLVRFAQQCARRLPDALSLGALTVAAILVYQLYTDIANQKLFDENFRLLAELDRTRQELREVEERIATLHVRDRDLRAFAELDSIPEDVRAVGVGGSVPSAWSPEKDETGLALERLDRELTLLESSMGEIRDAVASRVEELKHIPSIRPVREGRISSGYGPRRDPFTRHRRMHKGVDFQAPRGTEIVAPAAGRVIYANRMSSFGRTIKIDHGNGIETLFGHLHRIHVQVGQNIERGDVIGQVGSTGRSTSSHLHYEVRIDGRHTNPRDYFITDEFAWDE